MGKYSEIIAATQAEEDQARARAAGVTAPQVDPDAMGRAMRLADQRGLPPGVVADNLPEYDQQQQLDALSDAAIASPVLARWLGDPNHSALSKDDTGVLAGIGRQFNSGLLSAKETLPWLPLPQSALDLDKERKAAAARGPEMPASPDPSWFSELVGKFQSGWYQGKAASGLIPLPNLGNANSRSVEEQVARGLGYQSADDYRTEQTAVYVADQSRRAQSADVETAATTAGFQEIADAEKTKDTVKIARAVATNPRAVMAVVAQSLGNIAPQLALSAAMPASRVVAAVMAGTGSFAAEQGMTILDVMGDAGVETSDPAAVAAFLRNKPAMEKARQKALARGVAVGTFDALTAGFAGRLIANSRRTLASIGGRVAGEAAVQAGGGAAGEAVAQLASDGKITSQSDIFLEAAAEIPTFLAEGRGQIAEARRAAMHNADRFDAHQEQRAISDLVNLASQSKTRERSATRFELLIRDMTSEGEDTVYLSADGAQRLFQSANSEGGPDLGGLVDSDALREAIATGGEVAIPLAKYATLVTPELHAAVADQVRLQPGGRHDLPAVSSEEIQQAIDQGLAEAQQQDARENGPAGQVYDDVFGQLLSRQDEQLARQNASVVQSVYRNLAERVGTDAWTLYQQFKLRIPGATTDTRARPRGVDIDVDPLLDALRSGKMPTDREIYGDTLVSALHAAGGLRDSGGELANMDAAKARPGLVNNQAGMSLDDALVWAYQEGFITQAPTNQQEGAYDADAPDINTLLDLLAQELGGNPVYRPVAMNTERAAFRDSALGLQDELDQRGIDLRETDNATARQALGYANRTLEQSEPGSFNNPLPESEMESAPVGAWVAGPALPGLDTRRQIMDVPLDRIDPTEFDSAGQLAADKRAYAERYAEAKRAGEQFPNGRGSELPNGMIKLQDGHRRFAAARAVGAESMRLAVSPLSLAQAANFDQPASDFEASFGDSNAQQQFDESSFRPAVVSWAKGTYGDAIAPNGRPVWQNFVAWFGDSKVVDADGKPLVVYHGTRDDFSEFDPDRIGQNFADSKGGFFFTGSPALASAYASRRGGEGGNVMPVYLSLQNPLTLDAYLWATGDTIESALADREYKLSDLFDEDPAGVISYAKDGGHDGIFWKNGKDVFVVAFRPEQIKSATGNTGAFDPSNPNILFQPAFHGTPHDVDRFSLQKIGSGEGNQAFGWGLYFASQREVADFYRRNLTGIERNIPATMGDKALQEAGGDRGRAVATLTRRRDALPEAARGNTQAAIDWLRRGQNTGRLYQVEVPEDSDLLDWDAPLSEQPEKVRAALIAAGRTYGIEDKNARGSDLYADLVDEFDDRPQGASEYLLSIGIPGLRYRDGDSRGSGGTHNYVIWDEAAVSEPVRLFQSAQTDPLVAIHNLSPENLLSAAALGGLPVPSIGITKAATPFSSFGSITLIGRSDLATPGLDNPVFSGDAYTTRKPEIIWPKVPAKQADKFLARFSDGRYSDTEPVWGAMVNWPDRTEAIRHAQRSTSFMREWLREQGEVPASDVMEEVEPPSSMPWAADPAFMDAVRAEPDDYALREKDDPRWVALSKVAREAMGRYLAAKTEGQRERLARAYENAFDGEVLDYGDMNRAVNYVFKFDRPRKVSRMGTEKALLDQIGDRRQQFEQWAATQVAGVFGEPSIKVGNKKQPMTLENVVAAMASPNVRNREKTSTFSAGKVAAANTKKFKSLDEVKAARESVVGSADRKAATDSSDAALSAYQNAVTEFYSYKDHRGKIDTWAALDDSMKALAQASKKAATAETVRAALHRNGFEGVSTEAAQLGADALNAIRQTVVDYFEAKPQRAVSLSEFAGAVIPADSPPEVRAVLEAAGIPMREYSGEQEQSAATAAFAQELNQATGDVLFQDGQKAPRGSVTFGGTAGARVFNIELLAGMDASTFMHEMGHVYLEVLNDLAARDGAPAQIVNDMATLNAWLGRKEGEAFTTDQHEQFARGFEAYLREGKAPSSALRRAFASFKVWLTALYRSVRSLNVDLTDDVRGVMDRILASDAEIEEARSGQYQEALITDAVAVGMSPGDFERYNEAVRTARADAEATVAAEVLLAERREQQAWYNREKREVRAQVLEEVRNLPVYRAQRLLRNGKLPNGDLAPDELRVKLSKDELLDKFGQSFLRNLVGMYSVEGGVRADEAAAIYGFGSGRELIEALVNAPRLVDAVASETDARMKDRHPDPMTDGTLPDRAMVAAHRDRQADVMIREIRALEQHVNGRQVSQAAVIKGVARQIIQGKKLRHLQPATYRAAEARAGREAFEAAAKQDWGNALAARRRQLLNFELFREAVRARDEAARTAKYLAKFGEKKTRARLGKAGADYLDQVDGLLDRFDFRKISDKAADRRSSLATWIEGQAQKGIDVNLPPKIMDEAFTIPYREMTVADLATLRDAIRSIDHLARLKGKLLLAGEVRDAAEVDAAMAASLRSAHEARPITTGDRSAKDKIRQAFMQGRVLQATATDMARELDGFKDQGAIWMNTVGVMRDAVNNRLNPALQQAQDELAKVYVKHYSKAEIRGFSERVPMPEVNGDLWSKSRLLALALNWGNAGNREAILTQARGRMSPEQVNALLSKLDSRDWAFVEDVWRLIDSQWPAIADAQKRRTGLVPERVQASAFTVQTSDGKTLQIPGGYYPLKYEADSVKTMKDEADDFYNSIRTGRTAKAATRNGHTIERVGSGGRTVRLDTGVVHQHLRDVLRDVHLGDAVNYVHNVLNGQQFKEAVDATGTQEYRQALEVWLKDAAAGEIGPRVWHEHAMRAARQNFTASVLTFKVTGALLQLSGVVPTIVTIGQGHTMAGIGQYLGKPRAMTRYVREASPYMDSRLRTHIEAVQTVMDAEAGRFAAGKAATIRFGYWMIGRVQGLVDTVTWLAAEQAGMAKFGNDVGRARAYADDVVTRAQGSGEFIDKSPLQRGTLGDNVRQTEWIKATTALQGYMIAKGNLAYEQTRKANLRNPRQAMKWAADMVMLFAVEGLLTAALTAKLPNDDDDDGLLDDLGEWAIKDALSTFFGVIPGGGVLVDQFRGYDSSGVVAGAWRAYAELLEKLTPGEDGEVNLDKGVVKAAVSAAGVTLGLPSTQINKTIDAIAARADGRDVSPYEYLTGPTKEPK